MCDFHAANARDVLTRVEGEPLLTEIHFAVRVEIYRRARTNVANVWQVSGHVGAGRLKARHSAMAAWAKSRQTPWRRSITSEAERSDRPEPKRYSML